MDGRFYVYQSFFIQGPSWIGYLDFMGLMHFYASFQGLRLSLPLVFIELGEARYGQFSLAFYVQLGLERHLPIL